MSNVQVTFPCDHPICGRIFTRAFELKKHKVLHDNPDKVLHCSECDFYTLQKKSLSIHFAKHTGEKIHECSDNILDAPGQPTHRCEYRTNDPAALSKHRQKVHGYIPPPNRARPRLREPGKDEGYPECYNKTLWGPSGNMMIDGMSTDPCLSEASEALSKRGSGAGDEPNIDLTNPPYTIHNGYGPLSTSALATNATHFGGYVELDVHNLFGMMEEKATHLALQVLFDRKRPFLISRSTFPSSGRWTGHWLGDNYSKWEYLYLSIQGVLQFQIYQIPMVGADTCGFQGNTDEELCNRWMQLSAFTPFYRNHNTYGALPQEPYRWDSVANASRIAIAAQYSMLPYWYTLFANASTNDLPPVRALFYEFPNEPELFDIDKQWLIGCDILVTPVLLPGAITVDGIFPGRGTVIWRDWWTHAVVDAVPGGNTTLSAPISHINVHVRDSSILLLHHEPAYTIYETRQGTYSLLVSLNAVGTASGNAYVDDGESYPLGPNRMLKFSAHDGELDIESAGEYAIDQKLETITLLGVQNSTTVTLNSLGILGWTYDAANEELMLSNLSIDLNAEETTLSWQ